MKTDDRNISLKINGKIPNHMSWTVNMWHFGQDALTSYLGEKFDIAWKDSLNVFHHMYSKELGKMVKVRKEVQEQPNEPLEDAFIDKIDEDDNTKL
ncbi:MAG: hypothetical protein ACTHKF_01195, partial [Candidatus Nitrosocosmicus sp.]